AALKDLLAELGGGLEALVRDLAQLDAALAADGDAAILAAMGAVRTTVDALEKKVADGRWPLPKYRDMLFLY
ncbi:MAG: hypothetical protein IJ173_10350, partial [Kiritimatiellae bacterium]|nr:hypothetical protein [Kiritimatiellia bacterium]